MYNVTIKNKQGQVISDLNLYEDPSDFINHIVSTNYWGKPERIVRLKVAIPPEHDGGTGYFMYPDEQYEEEDVLETINDLLVRLKPEYTIEVTDYIEVPQEISRAQLQLALLDMGLLDDVEAFIESPECPRAIKIEWYNRLTFKRDNENLKTFAQQLGLTNEQLDQVFINGATL